MNSLTDVVPFVFLTVTGEMGVTEEQLLNNTPNSHNKSVPRILLCRTMVLCYVTFFSMQAAQVVLSPADAKVREQMGEDTEAGQEGIYPRTLRLRQAG